MLRRRGELSALVPAIAARMAVHIYQGPLPLAGLAAVGGVWGVYYYRAHRLWPVVIAHGLQDFLALAQMNAGAG